MALHVVRGGVYYRVCDPAWKNPADTTYAKRFGGRWNVRGEFGALYLNATIAVAAANARRALRMQFGDAVTFADIRPERRPDLQTFVVSGTAFIDAVSDDGIAACQRVARACYAAGEAGIAARSAVQRSGEELAVFDSHIGIVRLAPKGRATFGQWFPGLA